MFGKKDDEQKAIAPPIVEEKAIAKEAETASALLYDFDKASKKTAKERAKTMERKRRLYTLTRILRKFRQHWKMFTGWISENRDLVLLVSLMLFSALFGYILAFVRLHVSFKEIAVGIWDFFFLMGSFFASLILLVGKLYIPSGQATQELAKDIQNEKVGDDGRTLC